MKNFYDQLKHGLKLPNSYHLAFLEDTHAVRYFPKSYYTKQHKWYTILNDYYSLRSKKNTLRYKRKDYINKQFNYTEENMLKFEKLSNTLADMEIEILRKHRHISKTRINDLSLTDINFTQIENDFFNVLYYFTHENNSMYIYSAEYLLQGIPETDEPDQPWFSHFNKYYFYKQSVIDYNKYFSKFRQSKLFFDLINESYLSLADILVLSEVKYELKVSYF